MSANGGRADVVAQRRHVALFSFAQLLAKEIDGDERGYDDRGHHRRAANFLEGVSQIILRYMVQRNRYICCHEDYVDYCHYVELTFHVAHPHAPPPMNSAVSG